MNASVSSSQTSRRPQIDKTEAVPLESILCTEKLDHRPSRLPDYENENRALLSLTQALADSPQTILQTLADTILETLKVDSAGISVLTIHDGGKRFHWPAIAGVWKSHIGGGTPRDFGPCGDVLNYNSPLMMQHVERRYTYFNAVSPPAVECLLVPFYVGGKAVGTIWAVFHDLRRTFEKEDMRQLNNLGRFASAAYEVWQSLNALGHFGAIVESSEDAIISKNLEGIITSWNESAERLFGYTAQEAIGQPVLMLMPPDRVNEEPDILRRIRQGERIEHYETVRRRKDGTLLDISLTISPIFGSKGNIIGASKIARDISERKRMEAELRDWQQELESRVSQQKGELSKARVQLQAEFDERKRLEREVALAAEGERQRLGQELHDGLGQEVIGVGFMIDALIESLSKTSPKKAQEAQRVRTRLTKAAENARNLAKGFYPVEVEKHGLLTALKALVERVQESFRVSCTLQVEETDARMLAPDVAMQFFRIVQEAVQNACKHAEAKNIVISLIGSGNWELSIKDDGVGFRHDPEKADGMGARIMQYRARMIGGILEMRNEQDCGAIVKCTLLGTGAAIKGSKSHSKASLRRSKTKSFC